MNFLADIVQTPPSHWVTFIVAIGAILGGMGYATGQFLSSRRKGVSDALETALNEVAAIRLRADRLDEEMLSQRTKHDSDMAALRGRLAVVEAENKTLRETLASGIKLAPEFQQLISDQLKHHEERSEDMLRGVGDRLQEVAREAVKMRDEHEESALAAFEERVKARHLKFVEALPAATRKALLAAMEED